MTDGSDGGIMEKKQQHSLVVLRVSVFVSSSLLATCHMGSPLGLITKVHNVGEDGGEKRIKRL